MRSRALRYLAAGAMLLAIMVTNVPVVRAETFSGGNYNVSFTSNKKMESNFSDSAVKNAIEGMQPGDNATFTVNINNSYSGDTDWYMTNKTLQSLEDASNTAYGGGYTYRLTFNDAKGNVNVLYDSNNVGGESFKEKYEGLHEATGALEDFFYLTTLSRGQSGTVTLYLEVDGESQGNDYQDTLGKLALNFAVELPAEDRKVITDETFITRTAQRARDFFRTGFVKTSDDTNLLLLYIIAAIIGLLLIVIAIICICIRRKMKKGEDK